MAATKQDRWKRGLNQGQINFITELVLRAFRQTLRPPPKLTLSQWAERYAVLSPETSSSPGKFSAFAYQRGIMDAITDPTVLQVTVMKSARIGYTKLLDHAVGFYLHQDPSPILIVQPRVEDAEDYSRTEIAPMLRDTPVLSNLVGNLKAKDADQRIAKRVFKNGASISFVGANSPGGFRRITARIVMFDEVDGYPLEGAGNEGDQISLGWKRTESFWDRKMILGSTPTIKDSSVVERNFLASDQRRYYVRCPTCDHPQTLRWENMRWDKEADGTHLTETAHFVCEENGCVIEERDKPTMIGNGYWQGSKPFKGHAGFHIWAAYSLWPNARWATLVDEFLRVHKDPLLLRTFTNLVLGETWEDLIERVEGASLASRLESYGPDSLPTQVKMLTAGIDVQGDRLEMQVLGFGAREECWTVGYYIIRGDPAQARVWQELELLLRETYHSDDGRTLPIRAACIDMMGHHTNDVLNFSRTRRSRRIYAVFGAGGPHPIWPRKASKNKRNDLFFRVGVDTAKDLIYSRLRLTKPGPGYVHFPVSEQDEFGSVYFEQLTSEIVVLRKKLGRSYRVFELPGGRRNEALDTFVYALAARMSIPGRIDTVVDIPAPVIEVEDGVADPRPPSPPPPVARRIASLLPR